MKVKIDKKSIQIEFDRPKVGLFQKPLTPDDDEYYYPDLKFGLEILSEEDLNKINTCSTAREKANAWLEISPKGLALWDVDALERFFKSLS